MVNSLDGTFTNSELKRNLRRFVGIDDDTSNLALDKQDLHLLLGEVVRFYPCDDYVVVKLRDYNLHWRCRVSHLFMSHDVNVSFTPEGDYVKDNDGKYYIRPSCTYNCIVYPVNGDYSRYGAVLLGYVSLDDSDNGWNAGDGSFKVRVGSEEHNVRFKVREDCVEVKDEHGLLLHLDRDSLKIYTKDVYLNDEPIQNTGGSEDYERFLQLLEGKADKGDVYTRGEVDNLLEQAKSDNTGYSKSDVDKLLNNKVDKGSGTVSGVFDSNGVLTLTFNDELYK